mmetsp:Transcript_50500/g.86533  ORF Transcript_50500/g.86533 Transcript_50500/m.86533 type:complete len:251 (+) Transcript_50500:1-753(+)
MKGSKQMRALFLIFVHATSVAAFSRVRGLQRTRGIVSVNAVSDEAVAAYRAKFSKKRLQVPEYFKKSPFSANSLAGKEFYQGTKPDTKSKTKAKVSNTALADKDLKVTFKTIAGLYGGDDNALKMVQAVPTTLSYNAANMKLTKAALMTAFCGKFKEDGVTPLYSNSDGSPKYTEQDVVEMCMRNPLLIGIRAEGYGSAINSQEDTMQLSYVIAATRPIGGLLLATTLLLLITPIIKKSLGMDPLLFHLH